MMGMGLRGRIAFGTPALGNILGYLVDSIEQVLLMLLSKLATVQHSCSNKVLLPSLVQSPLISYRHFHLPHIVEML